MLVWAQSGAAWGKWVLLLNREAVQVMVGAMVEKTLRMMLWKNIMTTEASWSLREIMHEQGGKARTEQHADSAVRGKQVLWLLPEADRCGVSTVAKMTSRYRPPLKINNRGSLWWCQ